jgi:hypothetical protein
MPVSVYCAGRKEHYCDNRYQEFHTKPPVISRGVAADRHRERDWAVVPQEPGQRSICCPLDQNLRPKDAKGDNSLSETSELESRGLWYESIARFERGSATSGLPPTNGHRRTGPVGPVRADFVAKVG